MTDNTSGKRWSRGGLVFGAGLSLMGNVAHTFLAVSGISIFLRLPLAVVWPVALFVGIEILVRVNWRRKMIDVIGQALLIVPVSAVAAVVSYRHLHSLMDMAGEDRFSALIGPLAIDGLMLGATVALLAIRARETVPDEPVELPVQEEIGASQPIDPDFDISEFEEQFRASLTEPPTWPAPVSPAPVETKVRAPRARWDARRVCELALDGVKPGIARELTGVGESTFGRYLGVARDLKGDPRVEIDPKRKVPAEHVAILRELATR